jgi:hypothetical protein
MKRVDSQPFTQVERGAVVNRTTELKSAVFGDPLKICALMTIS